MKTPRKAMMTNVTVLPGAGCPLLVISVSAPCACGNDVAC